MFQKIALATRSAIGSRFRASAITIWGLLPPSSSETRFRFVSAECPSTVRPTSVEPVKAMPSMSGCRAIAVPMTGPGPVTTLRTPSGSPASAPSSAVRRRLNDVTWAGFITTALPVARIGPSFHAAIWSG